MKVLVVGFSKTGTKTLGSALTQLGYNVLDFDTTFYHLGEDWLKILTKGGTREDFYRMYKDFDASCDLPSYIFWEDILDAFPDMKLILTERNDDDWLRSIQEQITASRTNKAMNAMTWFSPTARRFFNHANHMGRISISAPMSGKFYEMPGEVSPNVLKIRYRSHNAAILLKAPKQQLLRFKLTDGWKPLCEFLGKPVPNKPFPHKNKGSTVFEEYVATSPVFDKIKQEVKIYLAIYVAMLSVLMYLAYNLM